MCGVLISFIVCCIFVFSSVAPPGSQTVVHPSARILAEAGPIVIGDGNLIQEQVTIVNRYYILSASGVMGVERSLIKTADYSPWFSARM